MATGETKMDPLVSVIIPVYNEEKTVGTVLNKLLRLQKELSLELIVVDDGSTDKTLEIVKEFPMVKLICHHKNCGKGQALASGFMKSRGQIIVIQDADDEYAPKEIPKIILPLKQGQADIVFGSRFLSNNGDMSYSHRFGNKILSLVARMLYNVNITDIMTGHKAFSREALNSIALSENGFDVEVEITGKLLKKHWTLQEVPISYKRRRHGESKITYKDGFSSLFKLLSGRFKQ